MPLSNEQFMPQSALLQSAAFSSLRYSSKELIRLYYNYLLFCNKFYNKLYLDKYILKTKTFKATVLFNVGQNKKWNNHFIT